MGEYQRSYPQAPTQEEIELGYAPSTISGIAKPSTPRA